METLDGEVLAGGFGEVARQGFLLLGAESADRVPSRAREAVAWAAEGAVATVRGSGVACTATRTGVVIDDAPECGGCLSQERSACCPVSDQGLVCDVRGVGEALAAMPERQGDASEGDFVSLVEVRGCADDASERVDEVPV